MKNRDKKCQACGHIRDMHWSLKEVWPGEKQQNKHYCDFDDCDCEDFVE